ncbi:MAG: RloB domain-containing protein [Azospirillaceae bacterium]|nr:RloB domain-containing protein [Azospirillaceae bacterium]
MPQRRRIFLGCEGESEQGYAALLSRLLEERHRRIHLEIVLLGGGDPLAIIQTAERQIRQRATRATPFAASVIMLDADRRDVHLQRREDARALASRLGLHLIWQLPCHEAFLLRHLVNCGHLHPTTSALAEAELSKRWPRYEKGMAAARLAERLDRAAVLRAAIVEEDLRQLLAIIEFGDAP